MMELNILHNLLADNRRNKEISRYEFIGRMLEAASDSIHIQDYAVECRHVFSASKRRPISEVRSRAIAQDENSNFSKVVDYVVTEITDRWNIGAIIAAIQGYENIEFSENFMIFVDSVDGLSYAELKIIYAAYVVRYWYACLFYSHIKYSHIHIPSTVSIEFSRSKEFYNECVLYGTLGCNQKGRD